MKKQLFIVAISTLLLGSAGDSFGQSSQNGVKVEGKKGGNAQAGNKKVTVNGKKGGGMKIDKTGMNIQGRKGSKLEITNKKKKK
jgi:hypothetical protein